MQYERVHTVWDFYDGIRTGVADLNGVPHYFASLFDESEDDYSGNFKLYPVGPEFMQRAIRYSDIFQAWERKFRHGEADVKTHPGHGGIDAEYDQLRSWLDEQIARLQPLPTLYRAKFRAIARQEGPPPGMLRGTEVAWSPSTA
jgi:hypothetical protein